MVDELDSFYAKLWKQGDSLVITVPSNLIKFGGFSEGTEVKVLIKKQSVSDTP